jgi:dTMP kinase
MKYIVVFRKRVDMMRRSLPGKLIVFEGIDGAGKSSVAARLMTMLQQEDRCDVLLTRQPGGTPTGQTLSSLLRTGAVRDHPEAEFLLFAADRAVHIHEVVEPALCKGSIVLCDRMGDSSYAYQGHGRGVDRDLIKTVNARVMRDIVPDVTVYLIIDYGSAQQRISTRNAATNGTYDHEQAAFFRAVAKGYEELYADRPEVMRIDATLPLDVVVHKVYQKVCSLIGCDGDGR